MKKFENSLIITVLILLFYGASKYSDTSIDIHFNDTFYLIASGGVAGCFAAWMLIVFFLFKVIRRRHQYVHPLFTFTYNILTLLFLGLVLLPGLLNAPSNAAGFTDADLDGLIFRNHLKVMAAWCLLALQVIFLIFFVFQLLKRPVIDR